MLLRSVRLKNFRPYKGEQSISFSCDGYRNVTVILGDNTCGKTTLVQAFNWALYGVVNFATKEVLNYDVSRQMHPGDKEIVEVEICLNHDKTDYIVTRSQEYYCDNKGVHCQPLGQARISYKQKDGQTEPIRSVAVNSAINKILPQDLSSYFFFDGERINSISNKQDVTQAVKDLLGLAVLDNAISHLNPNSNKSVIGKFKGGLDVGGNKKAEDALKRIQSLSQQRDHIASQLKNYREQIDHYLKLQEEMEDVLRENQGTAALQRRSDELERFIKQEESALESAVKRLIDDFNSNPIGFFGRPLIGKALGCLDQTDFGDKGIPDMNASSIDFVIERRRCICGSQIIPGSKEHSYLLMERDFLPPQYIGAMIRGFREQASLYQSVSDSYYEAVKARYSEMRRCKDRIQEWEEELSDIRRKIRGKENVRRYEENLTDYRKRLRELTSKKEDLVAEDRALENEIRNYQKLYDNLAVVSAKNEAIKKYIQYGEFVYDWFKVTYDSRESIIREHLERKVNDIFSQMYHGRRRVVISPKYRVTLLTADDEEGVVTDESGGLETVKNFAFIGGLVDLAREKVSERTGDQEVALSSEPYPLVMDAPFSNADDRHVSNISRILPQIAEQVIMVVMAKDWGFAEAVIGDKVGKRYFLDKKSETLTYIKEDVLNV